jgi:ABC-type nitrate/sulfonate/bicarbonate transport system substrate-binding protein
MRVFRAYAAILSAGWFLSISSLASAQLARINVGYSAISADQLPAWVAKETGIFAQNGLDAQLIFFTGGTTAILALVSNDDHAGVRARPDQ